VCSRVALEKGGVAGWDNADEEVLERGEFGPGKSAKRHNGGDCGFGKSDGESGESGDWSGEWGVGSVQPVMKEVRRRSKSGRMCGYSPRCWMG
jgi:hypothetical protein